LVADCIESNLHAVSTALKEKFGGVVWCPAYDARASALDSSWGSAINNCDPPPVAGTEGSNFDNGEDCHPALAFEKAFAAENRDESISPSKKLRIFSTTKPFAGHSATVQKNAIFSWLQLDPRPDIILYGNSLGTKEICSEFNLTHVQEIATNVHGTPLVNKMFEDAIARDLRSEDAVSGVGKSSPSEIGAFAYVNSDIVLGADFTAAISMTADHLDDFLMVGGRVNVPDWMAYARHWKHEEWSDSVPTRVNEVHRRVWLHGDLDKATAIDYFVYSSKDALPSDIPDFAVGRFTWDSWLLERGHSNLLTVDATNAVLAIHQKHDYSHWKTSDHTPEKKKLHLAREYEINKELGNHVQAVFINDSPYRLCCGHTTCGVRRRESKAALF